jgi:phage protein D
MARYGKYAPAFDIRLDGNPLPPEIRSAISSVTWQDGMEGADRVEVALANPSLRLLDHPLLKPDREFRLSIGYSPDPLEEVFAGEITGIEPAFPSSGMPTMRVTAQDYLNRLTKGKKDRAFRVSIPTIGNFPLPDPVVAALVAGLDGLIPALDPVGGALATIMALGSYLAFPQFSQLAVRQQKSESDFSFLSTIAKENGWEMFIDHTVEPRGRVLRFQFLIQDYTPSLTLGWGQNLIDFVPRLTTVGDIFGVTSRVWVDSIKMEFVIAVSWDYDRASINLSVFPSLVGDAEDLLGSDAKGKTVEVKPTGYANAAYKMMAELLPRLNGRLTGSGSAVGDPRIKASKVIQLDGLGSTFSGLYRITSATHTFDGGGYRTAFNARKEVWFTGPPLPAKTGPVVRLSGAFSA